MRRILILLMWLSLGLLTFPPVAYLAGSASLEQVHWMMLLATLVWFVLSPIVMLGEKKTD